jgi:hypothetical protein
MSFSIDHILNGNLSTIVDYLNDRPNIENFGILGLNAGNKSKILNQTQITNLSESTKDIDSSMMIENSAKLLSSVINNVVSNNQTALLQLIVASNNISLVNVTGEGDLNIEGVNQQNELQVDSSISSFQKTVNDITTQITDNVAKKFSEKTESSALSGTSSSLEGVIGKALDTVNALGTEFIKTAGTVLDGSLSATMGNKTSNVTKTQTENILKEKFNLKDTFEITSNEDFNNELTNLLSTDNIAKCGNESAARNNIELIDINRNNINIRNINQKNVVNATLNCIFNQDVVNKLATIFVTNYTNLVENMTLNTTTDNEGDILAVGTAGATLVCAAGSAVSEGAQGIGSGVGNAFEGIGGEIFKNPLSIVSCCFVLIAGFGAIAYMSMKSNSNSKSRSSEESTEESSDEEDY